MTEKVTKKYYCDFCGLEIDPESEHAIRLFGVNHSEGLVIRQMKIYESQFKTLKTEKAVAVKVRQADYCNADHLARHVERRILEERKKVLGSIK